MKKLSSSSSASASSSSTRRRGQSAVDANANANANAGFTQATTPTAADGETLFSTLLCALGLPPMEFDEISSIDTQKGKRKY
jgi:hypothetical protein